jgi:2-oxoglutarate ferredoxin oxidoreductase subunit beta
MVEQYNFSRKVVPNWCPGCGNFGIMSAVQKAVQELGVEQKDLVFVSGVGCFAKLPYWKKVNGFVGLHGRGLAVAQGIKLANPKLTVLAFGGDGDGYGEGGNHLIHASRRNVGITYLVHNNSVFGLTTGQYSPTAEKGRKSKSSPTGSMEGAFNPLAVAIASGAGFVARAYSGDINETAEIVRKAMEFPGFALVDVIQACPSFGRDAGFLKERVAYLQKEHDPANIVKGMEMALKYGSGDSGEKLYCGVFYKREK